MGGGVETGDGRPIAVCEMDIEPSLPEDRQVLLGKEEILEMTEMHFTKSRNSSTACPETGRDTRERPLAGQCPVPFLFMFAAQSVF